MEGSAGEIYPIPRNPIRFELLRMFEVHLDAAGGSLQDPGAPRDFIASLGQPLSAALAGSELDCPVMPWAGTSYPS